MGKRKGSNKPLRWLDIDKEGLASRLEVSSRTSFGTTNAVQANTPKNTKKHQIDWRVKAWAHLPRDVLLLDAQGMLRRHSIVYGEDLEGDLSLARTLRRMSEDDQEVARSRK
jgi:hypothetical protein